MLCKMARYTEVTLHPAEVQNLPSLGRTESRFEYGISLWWEGTVGNLDGSSTKTDGDTAALIHISAEQPWFWRKVACSPFYVSCKQHQVPNTKLYAIKSKAPISFTLSLDPSCYSVDIFRKYLLSWRKPHQTNIHVPPPKPNVHTQQSVSAFPLTGNWERGRYVIH